MFQNTYFKIFKYVPTFQQIHDNIFLKLTQHFYKNIDIDYVKCWHSILKMTKSCIIKNSKNNNIESHFIGLMLNNMVIYKNSHGAATTIRSRRAAVIHLKLTIERFTYRTFKPIIDLPSLVVLASVRSFHRRIHRYKINMFQI